MKELSTFLRKLAFARVEDWLVLFSAVMILVLMMLTVVDVSGRYLFRHPLQGSVEISELLLLVIIVLAIAGTQRVGGHVGMDILLDKLKRMRRPLYPALQTFALFVSEAVFVIVLFYCFRAFLASVAMNETSAGPLYVIVWPAKGILCLGLLFMCVRLAIQLSQAVKSIRVWGR